MSDYNYDHPSSRKMPQFLGLLGFVVIILLGAFYLIRSLAQKKVANISVVSIASALPSPPPAYYADNITDPVVLKPLRNSTVTSPFVIQGAVPPGWIFEGVFPVELIDSSGNLIFKTLAKEKTPGSWQSGKPVEFLASVTFSTSAASGFIVLSKDNPSGLPEKAGTFRIPVNF